MYYIFCGNIMIEEHYYIPIYLYIMFNIIFRANKSQQKQIEYAWNGKLKICLYCLFYS